MPNFINQTLKRVFLFIPLLILFIFAQACKTTEPTPPVENPPGYQDDIPWPSLADSPWPMSQHDPQNTGRTNVTGPSSASVIWEKHIEGGLLSGPVIDDKNSLFFGNDQQISDWFYSLPAKTDSFNWKIRTNDGERVSDGMIVTGNGNIIGRSFSYIYSFSQDGKINWKFPFDGLRQNFNITKNGEILAINGEGNLIKLSIDGVLISELTYGDGFYPGISISPEGDKIIINGKDENLYCLNLDGEIIWKKFTGKSVIAPLIDSNGTIYICVTKGNGVVKQLKSTGEVNWEYDKNLSGIMYSAYPTLDRNGNFFFYAGDSAIATLSIFSLDYGGKLRWIFPLIDEENRGQISSQIACDFEGKLYFGSDQGYYYYCLSNDGNLLWKYQLNSLEIDGAPAFGKDGALFFGGHSADILNNLIGIK